MLPTTRTNRTCRCPGAQLAAGGLTLAALGCLAGLSAATLDEKVDFNFGVRPILSDRCFKCHGPDEKSRKAKLRLDLPEAAFAAREGVAKHGQIRPLVPGHPEQSEVYRRITSTNADEQMPPRDSNLSLTREERSLIGRWIAQGAPYQPHWAFIPVAPVTPPKPRQAARERNPIDAFVLARLEREGLTLAPEASRETLIRRVTFDLTGLPPTVGEIDSFLADPAPDAYEKVVDRLLASPAYGEHCAREWLDLARYADTYGYQNDVEVDLSPWRDWVIRAFNSNLPYDQFVVDQLAGDLLPKPTRDQVLATAFNRLHRQTNEGGSIDEEFRIEYCADRVQTAATTFLGVTLQCARCHDHKFDPIKQRNFYRMLAFFDNIDESGLYSHFTRATPSPSLLLYPEGAEAKHRALVDQIHVDEAKLLRRASGVSHEFNQWRRSRAADLGGPVPVAAFDFDRVVTNTTPNRLDDHRPAALVDGPALVPGRFGQALHFSGDNSVVCQGVGAFNRTTPFSFSLWLRPSLRQERAVILHRSRAWSDSGSRGYELLLEDLEPSFALIHFWPGNAIKVRATSSLPTNQWSQVVVTYDGSSRASGIRLYLNGAPLPVAIVRDHLFKDILHRAEWGDFDVGNIELTLAGRFRDAGFKEGDLDQLEVFDRALTPVEVRLLAGKTQPAPSRDELLAYYYQRVDPAYKVGLANLQRLREEENRLIDDVPEIMAMHEMSPRRQTYVLKRGAYDARAEPVDPGTPEAIFPFSPKLPRNRLGLARWMVDPRNPLTARVEVNRVWKSHFGRGLVATVADFGSQGKLPTHPALLDWLAGVFMNGTELAASPASATGRPIRPHRTMPPARPWDLKQLHRLIVLSATYRQSSRATPELLAKDPENRLLARGPTRRLEAEEIRDNALAISGLLSREVGGPSVRPYQPAGLWEEAGTGKHYVPDKGDKLYRRSLYTFWKRTAPPPSMLAFDAPSREVCTAKREATATPLQALVLLDDPQFVEAARVLAERFVREANVNLDARIDHAFRMAVGRHPLPPELHSLARLYQEELDLFAHDPAGAEHYSSVGDHPPDRTLPPAQVAAATALASTLMNLDEFVMNR